MPDPFGLFFVHWERPLRGNVVVIGSKSSDSTIPWVLATSLLAGGAVAQLVALLPVRVGNVDWEFGTLGELAATGPLFVMGSAAFMFVATRARRSGPMLGSALLSLAWAVVLLAGVVILALDVPLIIRASESMPPEASRSVRVVAVKTGALLLVELAALLAIGVLGFSGRRSRSRSRLGREGRRA